MVCAMPEDDSTANVTGEGMSVGGAADRPGISGMLPSNDSHVQQETGNSYVATLTTMGHLASRIIRLEDQVAQMRSAMASRQAVSLPTAAEPSPESERTFRLLAQISGPTIDADANEEETRHARWDVPGPSTMPSPAREVYRSEAGLSDPVAGLKVRLANELNTAGVEATLLTPIAPPPPDRNPAGSKAIRLPRTGRLLRRGSAECYVPTDAEHEEYIAFFFAHIGPFHPCCNENEVRQRSARLFSQASASPSSDREVSSTDTPFLALVLCIYACVDIFRQGVQQRGEPMSGYYWYRTSQELVGRRQITSSASDLTGIQVLCLQALYLCHCGSLDSGYAAIGRACRLAFQHGLHHASRWTNLTPFQMHMRQRVMYTVFFMDRRIAHSCGQPYGIRSADLAVTEPIGLLDKDVYPERPLPPPISNNGLQPYMSSYVSFAHLVGQCWDSLASPLIPVCVRVERVGPLDQHMTQWIQQHDRVASDPFATLNSGHTLNVEEQQRIILRTVMLDLRLQLHRPPLIGFTNDEATGLLCGELATAIIDDVFQASTKENWDTAYYLRHHAPTILFSPLIALAALLIRQDSPLSIRANAPKYQQRFKQASGLLRAMSTQFALAAHVDSQLSEIIRLTEISSSTHRTPNSDGCLSGISLDIVNKFSNELENLAREGSFAQQVMPGDPDWLESALRDFWNSAAALPQPDADLGSTVDASALNGINDDSYWNVGL